jgi:hypothetical protein
VRYWVLALDGRSAAGPYEIAQLKQLPGFKPASVIAPENATSANAWQPAHSFDDLRSLFIKPPTLPPPRSSPAWPPASLPTPGPPPQAAIPASSKPTPQPASGSLGGDSTPVLQRPVANSHPKNSASFSSAWIYFAAIAGTAAAIFVSQPAPRAWLARHWQAVIQGKTHALTAKPLKAVAKIISQPAIKQTRRRSPIPRPKHIEQDVPRALPLAKRPLDVKMMRAAQACRWASVRKLVRQGANVNVRGREGGSPLSLAIGKCRSDLGVVIFLVASGASVSAPDGSGRTPLCEAVLSEHPNIVRLLLKSGAASTDACEVAALLTLASRRQAICLGSAQQDPKMRDFPPPGIRSSPGPCPYDKIYDEIISLLSNAETTSGQLRSH